MFKRVAKLGILVSSAFWLSISCQTKPARSAERIFASFLSFEQSVSVKSLETFAETGRITGDFIPYARYISPEQRPFFQNALQQKLAISPVALSQFLYSDIGELMVQRVARVIRPKSNHGGFYALRGALIVAAADPEGLTVLNFLKHYPIQGLKIDLSEGLAVFSQIRGLIRQTNTLIQVLENQSPASPIASSTGSALTQQGQYSWQKTTLTLSDQSATRQGLTGQSRQFPVDIYLPQTAAPKPIVVISHGLNSNRNSYAYLAEYLASHGFVVVMPEHIGSNTNQLQALMLGRVKDVTQPIEFLDRPLDVRFILDELERLATADPMFQGQLNLEQVGVIGQSFGGYTALAVAGATINFGQLQQDCGSRLKDTINISLILQCQALKLPQQRYKLADPRVKGVIAINPVDSSVLGETLSQIQTPVMLVSGSADKVSPSLLEQATPFTWLTTADKYFVLMQGGTHFSTIAVDPSSESEAQPESQKLSGPSPDAAKSYLSVLSLAFMKQHIAEEMEYQSYLSPEFVATLRLGKLKLNLTQTLSTHEILNPR